MIPLFDESGLAAVLPESLDGVRVGLRSEFRGAPRREPKAAARNAGLAIIPVHGMISKGESLYSLLFGGANIDRIVEDVEAAAVDPDVRSIVLHVDSPGGAVFGVDEAAERIAAVNKRKPVVAFTDGMMASAAYWLGSAAGQIVATPSAEVGAIGVYVVHMDESEALAKLGVKPTLIKAGEHKAEDLGAFPLSEEARAHLQARVDAKYRLFTRTVAKGRSAAKGLSVSVETVRGETFGGGRLVGADDAVKVGMIDRVGVFADVVRDIGSRSAAARADAGMSELALEIELAALGL